MCQFRERIFVFGLEIELLYSFHCVILCQRQLINKPLASHSISLETLRIEKCCPSGRFGYATCVSLRLRSPNSRVDIFCWNKLLEIFQFLVDLIINSNQFIPTTTISLSVANCSELSPF